MSRLRRNDEVNHIRKSRVIEPARTKRYETSSLKGLKRKLSIG